MKVSKLVVVNDMISCRPISADLPPFSYPPVSQVHNCTTDIVDTNLTVSCHFNNGSVLGYYVLVQFAEDLMLLTGKTQDGSPVEFQDLPANGVYNVVVFPLTGNGLLLPSRNKSL